MGSSSSSSSATTNNTRDGRVAGDNGAIGISSEGNVQVHMVADEAFQLGEEALREMSDLAGNTTDAAEGLATKSFDTSESLASMVMEAAREYAGEGIAAANSSREALELALGRTQDQSRTEATQLIEQLIRLGIPMAALAFAATKIWGK